MYLLSQHARTRMTQRGLALRDAELIALIGTEVVDGYLVRDQDCQRIEREIKGLLGRIWRLRGKRLVIASGQIVTAYHASPRHQHRLLRRSHECDLRS